MIQCNICEGWFHCTYSGHTINLPDMYTEMTCLDCMERHPFLYSYDEYARTSIPSVTDQNSSILLDISEIEIVKASSFNYEPTAKDSQSNKKIPPIYLEHSKSMDCKKPPNPIDQILSPYNEFKFRTAKIWQENFRQILCCCQFCLELYKQHHVTSLLTHRKKYKFKPHEDCYGPGASNSLHVKGMNSLTTESECISDALTEYNDMKSDLLKYLQTYAESDKTVQVEDIQKFITSMDAKNKVCEDMPFLFNQF